MAIEPLTGTTYPTMADGPLGGLQIGSAVIGLADNTIPRFADAAARDTAYAQWVTDGGTMANGMTCWCESPGAYYDRIGGGWVRRFKADVTLGESHLAAQMVLPDPGTWADVATVIATSSGRLCVARWSGAAFNGASGADRAMSWRVVCDGAAIGSLLGIAIPLTGAPRVPRFASFSSTPSAASHTWKLQAQATVASAVYAETALLTVVER